MNAIASTTFGILLIHANSDAMRQWLWKDVLDNVGAYDSAWMPLHAIGSVVMVFAVCSIIDLFRIRFVERPCLAWWDKHEGRIVGIYKKFERKAFVKLKNLN